MSPTSNSGTFEVALRTIRGAVGFALCIATALTARASAADDEAGPGKYPKRSEVQSFITEMVDRHGFRAADLNNTFARARFQPEIVSAMSPQPTGVRNWQAYRARFLNQRRVDHGVRFWAQHRDALARASAQYGVPEEIIVSIIGVETEYGRNMGTYRVLDALATLSFDYPRRAAYFRTELEHFLLFTRESRSDVLGMRGSYAGAVGIPQFMPASYRRFAVDFDRDGRRDLLGSPVDAIGSVANYLREHGWERGQPIGFPAEVDGTAHELLLIAGISPAFRVAELPDYGVRMSIAGSSGQAGHEMPDDDAQVALVELDTPGQVSAYWVGFGNFYAITRYNQSSFYAISVLELANTLRAERSRSPTSGGKRSSNR